MRKIKFRGKRFDNGEWVYGDLIQRVGYYPSIIETIFDDEGKIGYNEISVEKNTIGQLIYCGCKSLEDIYEGDIVDGDVKGVIKYDEDGYLVVEQEEKGKRILHHITPNEEIYVVGNIYTK